MAKLSPAIKKSPKQSNSAPPHNDEFSSDVHPEPEFDDEDTEEEVEALAKDMEAAIAELPSDSHQAKLLAALLLKVRGFIAKVCHLIYSFNHAIPLSLTFSEGPSLTASEEVLQKMLCRCF